MSDAPRSDTPKQSFHADPVTDVGQRGRAVKDERGGASSEDVSDSASDLLKRGRMAGAERASGLAHAIHRAADDLEQSSPDIARHVRSAADSLGGISDALRERPAGQLLEDAKEFAARQPAMFFGVAAVAGFALARFAKSTARHADDTYERSPGGNAGRTDEQSRPATMAAATLGGAVAHRSGQVAKGSMPTSSPAAAGKPDTSPPPIPEHTSAVPDEREGTPL